MRKESMQRLDVVSPGYSPDILPRLVGEQRPSGLHFVIYKTSQGSTAPADQWIIDNYGLSRYTNRGVPLTVRNAWEVNPREKLEGLPVILPTGSINDLARQDEYPWIARFRKTVLRQAINKQWPTLAPCFGLAQMAQLYAEPGQDAFPKGIKEFGRVPIEVVSNHPLFHGLENPTGYTHHNGSIPLELLEANSNQMRLHAVTRDEQGNVIPAFVTFGGLATIGTSFHREILDDESRFLFLRSAEKHVQHYVADPEAQKTLLTTIELNNSMQPLQDVLRERQDAPDVMWVDNYLRGGRFDRDAGGQDYNQLASFLLFDNLLRLAIVQSTGQSMPDIGIGEKIEIHRSSQKERTPLYGFIKEGQLFTAELAGSSQTELQELSDLYIHGFGDHLPMSLDEHKQMVEKGDVIVIRNAKGELIGTRAMVYSPEDANPFDKHVSEQHAYQNHTIIHEDFRGKGLIEEMTAIAVDRAKEKGKNAIITSVRPNNVANLRALTRQGYILSIYSPDHFGPEEERYMLELPITEPLLKPSPANNQVTVAATDVENAAYWLNQNYRGINTIVKEGTNYVVFQEFI